MPKSNRNCAVGGCSHTQRTCPKGRFVGFPNESKQPERRALWIRLVQRGKEWVPTKNSRVCGCHFTGGYKVDDPRDPAYNPSIFPARPELDRRVRRAAVSDMLGFQVFCSDKHKSVKNSRNQADTKDSRKYMLDVIDLSKQAEDYAQTKRSETGMGIGGTSNLVTNATGAEMIKCPIITERLQHRGNENCSGSVPTLASATASPEFVSSPHDQLPTTDQLHSQSHGWLYTNQSKPGDENEVLRRKRLLQARRSMNAVRVQRFTATNRKLSGNLHVFRNSRYGQTRHIVRTPVDSTVVDQGKATDLSVCCSSEQRLATDNLPRCHAVPPSSAKSEIPVQTVLSMAGHSADHSALNCTHLPTEAQSRCFGFHGWSDICFCETMVQRLTGVVPNVFNILVDKLQDVMPGLPPHNSLLLFLMKLKTAVPFELLGKIFGITAPTACNIFTHVLSILVAPLSVLIPWPSPDLSTNASVTRNNPNSWLFKCYVVIDCLTILTRLHLPEHNAEISPSKMTIDSVKILTGLTPNGYAFFVSSAYVGTVPNADIFVHSVLPRHLKKDTKILLLEPDKQLQQTLIAQGFQVMAPPFDEYPLGKPSTINSKMFSVFESGKIRRQMMTEDSTVNNIPHASPRINPVELTISEDELVDGLPQSVDSLPAADSALVSQDIHTSYKQSQSTSKLTQQLRSFSILGSILESELLPFINDVVCVCAAINNLQESNN